MLCSIQLDEFTSGSYFHGRELVIGFQDEHADRFITHRSAFIACGPSIRKLFHDIFATKGTYTLCVPELMISNFFNQPEMTEHESTRGGWNSIVYNAQRKNI
jgi:hypothetical protein